MTINVKYGGRRLNQYNEDDFQFQFLFLSSIEHVNIETKKKCQLTVSLYLLVIKKSMLEIEPPIEMSSSIVIVLIKRRPLYLQQSLAGKKRNSASVILSMFTLLPETALHVLIQT